MTAGAVARARPLVVACLVLAIACGLFFRAYRLDGKVVWSDEVFTQLRIAGLTEGDVVAASPAMPDVATLRAYVAADPAERGRGSRATIDSLASEDPQHTPLYYLAARAWAGAFGDSIAAQRLLSALVGTLALPAAFWFAWELIGSAACAWIFVAFVAVSPYFVLYSQEAREYSLWSVALFVTSACALRAARVASRSAWIAYAISVAIALYTDPLSLAIVAAHAGFFATSARGRLRRASLLPAAAIAAGLAAFAPWLLVIANGRRQIDRDMAWIVAHKDPLVVTLRTFLGEWHLAIVDFNIVRTTAFGVSLSLLSLGAALAAAVAFWRGATPRARTFVLWLAAATIAPLLGPDLLAAGHRSANPRYLMPMFACIELALAFAIWRGIERDRRWTAALGAVAFAGIASCAVSSAAPTWWTKYNMHSIALARTINRSAHPIVVSDNYVHLMLTLAPYLKPGTRIALRPRCYLCGAPAPDGSAALLAKISATDDVFLLGPSDRLRRRIRADGAIARARVTCIDVANDCAHALELF